jgi:uncharacterized protein
MIKIEQHPQKGRIVVATDSIAAGTTVCSSRVRGIAPKRDTHSMQKAQDKHVYIDQPGEIFAHSCEPNLAIRDNEDGAFDFVTLAPVDAGMELCFHYGMTEAESVAVADCLCGSSRCLGKSVGFWELPAQRQAELYQMGISTFLQTWYHERCNGKPHDY